MHSPIINIFNVKLILLRLFLYIPNGPYLTL